MTSRGYYFRATHTRVGPQRGWIEAVDAEQAEARLTEQGFVDVELNPDGELPDPALTPLRDGK